MCPIGEFMTKMKLKLKASNNSGFYEKIYDTNIDNSAVTGIGFQCRSIIDYSTSGSGTFFIEVDGLGTWQTDFTNSVGSQHQFIYGIQIRAHDGLFDYGYRTDNDLDYEGINNLKFVSQSACTMVETNNLNRLTYQGTNNEFLIIDSGFSTYISELMISYPASNDIVNDC